MTSEDSIVNIGKSTENHIIVKDALAEKTHVQARLIDESTIEIIDSKTKYGFLYQDKSVRKATISFGEFIQIGFSKIFFEEILAVFKSFQLRKQKKINVVEDSVGQEIILTKDKAARKNRRIIKQLEIDVETFKETQAEPPILKIEKKQLNLLGSNFKYLFLPLFALIMYFAGNFIASLKKESIEISPYGTYIPLIPAINYNAISNREFINCSDNKLVVNTIKNLSFSGSKIEVDKTLLFSTICDDFEEVKGLNKENLWPELMQRFINKQAQINLFVDRKSQNILLFLYIGEMNKFSIKHYINKRYGLSSSSSYDAEVYIFKDKMKREWLSLSLYSDYPGQVKLTQQDRGIVYSISEDKCETYGHK